MSFTAVGLVGVQEVDGAQAWRQLVEQVGRLWAKVEGRGVGCVLGLPGEESCTVLQSPAEKRTVLWSC